MVLATCQRGVQSLLDVQLGNGAGLADDHRTQGAGAIWQEIPVGWPVWVPRERIARVLGVGVEDTSATVAEADFIASVLCAW